MLVVQFLDSEIVIFNQDFNRIDNRTCKRLSFILAQYLSCNLIE